MVPAFGDPDRQRRHALPGRFDHDGDQPAGPHAAPDRPSDLCRRPRRAGQARVDRAPRPITRGAARVLDARRDRPPGRCRTARCARRRHRARAGRRARRRAGLEAHAGPAAGGDRRTGSIPRRTCPRRPSTKAAPSCSGWPRTTSPCWAIASTTWCRKTASPHCASWPAAAWACCARRRKSGIRPASPRCRAKRGPWPVRRCRCWWSPSPTPAPPCTAPGYTDYIGVKRYNDRGEVIGEHRFIGLFTSTAYSARVSETPLLRGKVEAIAAARRLAAGRPPGQGAGPHPGDLSARRPVPDTGRRPVRDGAGHPGPGRAPAAAPVRVARPVRPLRLVPGVRAARGLFHRPAGQVPAHPAAGVERHPCRIRRAA